MMSRRRLSGPSGSRQRRAGARRWRACVLSWLALATLVSPVLAQTDATGPSPGKGYVQVIAQGVADLPSEDLVWWVERDEASAPTDPTVDIWPLGFVLADDGVLVVETEGTGERSRLAPGEAMFVPDGSRQTRVGLNEPPGMYWRIDLIAAADADPGDAVTFISDPLAAPAAEDGIDLDLVRSALAPGQQAEVPGGDSLGLVIVTAGSVEVSAGADAPVPLGEGEAIALAGDLVIAGKEPAVFVAAVIGPAVPRLIATPDAGDAATVDEQVDPAVADGDGDGLPDADEVVAGTDPARSDTDADGATDGEEVFTNGTDPLNASDGPSATADTDGDGVTDYAEFNIHGSDPALVDSDGDGLDDATEVFAGLSPISPDSDGDGIADGNEASGNGQVPCVSCLASDEDEDGDGVSNGDEINHSTDPFDPESF